MAASSTQSSPRPAPQAIILAAGKGKRMGSDLPKVLHHVGGKPMVQWVVEACRQVGVKRCIVVIGHGGELVKEALAGQSDCVFVVQTELLGTGHAAQTAQPMFVNVPDTDVFVLAGDGPLIRAGTLTALLEGHRKTGAKATLATSVVADPSGYGRVIRAADGSFGKIVEQKDSSPSELLVREINPSYYCFSSTALFDTLKAVRPNNAQGEYYLTDVPGLLKTQGQTVTLIDAVPPEDVLSINTPVQLAEVDSILRKRLGMPPAPSTPTSQQASPAAATPGKRS
jgi:bifunctional UDP-N-acetylglucosamine pyrophosphorylase/glucosamine-1-phosphate N-acetyltransferase